MIFLILGTLFLILGIIYIEVEEDKNASFFIPSLFLIIWISLSTLFYCASIGESKNYLSGKKEPKIIQDNGRTYKEYSIGISTIKIDVDDGLN